LSDDLRDFFGFALAFGMVVVFFFALFVRLP
jgi:hypothetical protein